MQTTEFGKLDRQVRQLLSRRQSELQSMLNTDSAVAVDRDNGTPLVNSSEDDARHEHVIGRTGTGKTTYLVQRTIRDSLLELPGWQFVIDPMGSLVQVLILFFASIFCPKHIRDRVRIIRPRNGEIVCPIDSLCHNGDLAEQWNGIQATVESMQSTTGQYNAAQTPRLTRILQNLFQSSVHAGISTAESVHLLLPSDYQQAILNRSPALLRAQWDAILNSKSGRSLELLDSTLNRMVPLHENPNLRRTFSSLRGGIDIENCRDQNQIVLVDLSTGSTFSLSDARIFGQLLVNKVLRDIRANPDPVRPVRATFDEFQEFATTPEMQMFLAIGRQLGIRFCLSHQSFSQLQHGDMDLTPMVFQCQKRVVFGLSSEDAEIMAREFATGNFDEYTVKQEIFHTQQRHVDDDIIPLLNGSRSTSRSKQRSRTSGYNSSSQ